jgi:hypothetical protein
VNVKLENLSRTRYQHFRSFKVIISQMSDRVIVPINEDATQSKYLNDASAEALGPSRQTVALAYKALSFQKRQKFTNCCCIA